MFFFSIWNHHNCLSHGTTAIRDIFTITVRRLTLVVRICRRQILTTKVDPRAVRVKAVLLAHYISSIMVIKYVLCQLWSRVNFTHLNTLKIGEHLTRPVQYITRNVMQMLRTAFKCLTEMLKNKMEHLTRHTADLTCSCVSTRVLNETSAFWS